MKESKNNRESEILKIVRIAKMLFVIYIFMAFLVKIKVKMAELV